MAARKILLLNGPNLDMLGTREPDVYGDDTLAHLEEMAVLYAHRRNVTLSCFQSNSESDLIGKIQLAAGRYDGIVYNPGAHTHYSYALRDAIGSVDVPTVEVHISDIDEREAFRRISVIAPACVAQVKGLGFDGYCRAIDILCDHEGLERLGEGFESRYPRETGIIVSGGEALAPGRQDEAAPLDKQPQAPAVEQRDGHAAPPEDFTAPFAHEIAAADAGLLSFERQNLVRSTCAQLGIDALLVRDTSNIRWITAYDNVFDDERAHALLVSRGPSVLHTDTRYSNAMRAAAQRIASDIAISDERVSHVQFAHGMLSSGQVPFRGMLGIEDTISYAEFAKLAEAFGTAGLAATTDVVTGLRAVKSPYELCRMRAAQAVTDAAFDHILRFIRPNMTEREVQLELDGFMLRHGAESLSFSSIVATGANGADPHAIPGATRLEAGQCLVMDFGAKAHGYCSDMTRTVFLGQPSQKMIAAWATLRSANETVESMLRPGVTGKEAQAVAEQELAKGGFGNTMGHGLGHGVGIDVHELPMLNAKSAVPLVAGNVVTVEPGIYLPGEFGMRLEDCGVVTDAGFEPFTRIGHDAIVL